MSTNFALDTLVLCRHAQLAHAFNMVELSKLKRIRLPEVKVDDSGDYVALGASTDCFFWKQDLKRTTVGVLVCGKTPEEQVEAVFASSSAVWDATCPKIKQIVFSLITTCLKD